MAPKKSGRLTIARLTVHRVLGVEDSTIDLDTITVLRGANATGKSTHLKALRSALGIDRTALARLERVGVAQGPEDEPASVEVLLVGDGREVQVTRKGDGSPEVKERVGEDWRKVPRPVEWLRQLIDVQGANPALWLAADDEARAAAVLESMPLPGYSRKAALEAAGLADFNLPAIPDGLHALEDLEKVEDAVRSSRTVVNGHKDAEHDAAAKLLSGLPAEAPGDLSREVLALEKGLESVAVVIGADEAATAAKHQQAQDRVGAAFKLEAARLRDEHRAKAAEVRAAAERRVAELLAETEVAIDAARTRGEQQLQEAAAEQEAERQALEARKTTLAEGREKLAALRARQESVATDRHVRKTAAEAQEKSRQHAARAAVLSKGIEALQRYRLQLAEKLPIKGLAVKFDEKGRKSLTLDGVPLSQVNDGRLVELATEVSLLRARRPDDGTPFLPIVLLDGLERLNAKKRGALLREIASRGSQVVAAVVAEDTFKALRGDAALEPQAVA